MAMDSKKIHELIKKALPDAKIILEDWQGDQDHFRATIVSRAFRGKTRVQQHQMIYRALGSCMGNELHALALTTRSEEDKEKEDL